MSTLERPGLARTDRGVSRPLRAWLSRALRDDDALDELALAWSAHTLPARRQLVSLLFRDVSDEQVDRSRAQALFVAMLALEDDRALQAELLTKLRALEPVVAAFVYGDEQRGGSLLARQRSPEEWECLLVDWTGERATRVAYTTVAAATGVDVLESLVAREGGPPETPGSAGTSPAFFGADESRAPSAREGVSWQEVATSHACERFALPLIRFTRGGGELPPEAERFASVVTRG